MAPTVMFSLRAHSPALDLSPIYVNNFVVIFFSLVCYLFLVGLLKMLIFFFLFTERLGFEVPTLVQAQAIPVILSGRHAYPFSSF